MLQFCSVLFCMDGKTDPCKWSFFQGLEKKDVTGVYFAVKTFLKESQIAKGGQTCFHLHPAFLLINRLACATSRTARYGYNFIRSFIIERFIVASRWVSSFSGCNFLSWKL